MREMETDCREIRIIGYGNRRRGDDGTGPYMVKILEKWFGSEKSTHFRSIEQLTPDIIGDLQNADFILFVDATTKKLKRGWRLCRVRPDFSYLPFLTHHITPAFVMGLLQSVYGRSPKSWLVSVQGYDFGLEKEFYPETKRNIENAVSFIFRLLTKIINKKRAEEIIDPGRLQWETELTY